jgi:predicted RNA binding protein YcfA (HicA-like mRNA interferase family)
MTRLPVLSGKRLIKALCKAGYYIRDQQGSHIHLRHPLKPPLTVPNHKTIARGTLKAILKASFISMEELLTLLGK